MSRWSDRIFRSDRTYIVPNGAGIAFGGLFFLLLFLGAALNRPLLQLIGFMIAIPYLSAMVQSNGNVKDLKIRVLEGPLAAAGTTVEARVILEHHGKNMCRKVWIGLRGSPRSQQRMVDRIDPGNPIEIRIPLGTFKRGIHPLHDLSVTSNYPLGMFHTWKRFKSGVTAWIHPSPSGALPWRQRSSLTDDSRLEYREHRPANLADSSARIDWKRLARDQKRLIRVYDSDPEPKVVLRWNEVRHLPVEDALSQMTRWLIDAERAGFDATVEAPFTQGPVTANTMKTHLKALAGYGDAR